MHANGPTSLTPRAYVSAAGAAESASATEMPGKAAAISARLAPGKIHPLKTWFHFPPSCFRRSFTGFVSPVSSNAFLYLGTVAAIPFPRGAPELLDDPWPD